MFRSTYNNLKMKNNLDNLFLNAKYITSIYVNLKLDQFSMQLKILMFPIFFIIQQCLS